MTAKKNIQSNDKQSPLEKIFENGMWFTRFFVLLPVIFSLITSIALFILASIDVLKLFVVVYQKFFLHVKFDNFSEDILGIIIGSIDMYMIGIVVLIFAFGVYELFISKVDVAQNNKTSSVLEIHTLEELKDKISKVIVIVLIVTFFKRILEIPFDKPIEMFYFAGSIFAICLGLFFLHGQAGRKQKEID